MLILLQPKIKYFKNKKACTNWFVLAIPFVYFPSSLRISFLVQTKKTMTLSMLIWKIHYYSHIRAWSQKGCYQALFFFPLLCLSNFFHFFSLSFVIEWICRFVTINLPCNSTRLKLQNDGTTISLINSSSKWWK